MERSLSNTQFSYREGWSTVITLYHVVAKMQEQIEDKGYALATFLQIEGTSDRTHYDFKKKVMSNIFPETIIDWSRVCWLADP